MSIFKKLGVLAAIGMMSLPMLVAPVYAQDLSTDLDLVAGTSGLTASDLPTTIGNIINVLLTILGIVLLGYILYAGFLWMTSGGSSDKADKAKTMMLNAVIGLIIILSAYAISNFVIDSIQTSISV